MGGGGWGGVFRKPTSNHKELYCRDKRSILNVHFKEEASLLIQKRKSARYENSFCSLSLPSAINKKKLMSEGMDFFHDVKLTFYNM